MSLLLALSVCNVVIARPTDLSLPEVEFDALVAADRAALIQLRATLADVGAVVISGVPSLGRSAAAAFAKLPACMGDDVQAHEFRRTVAAHTMGDWSSEPDEPACSRPLQPLRQALSLATDALLRGLDTSLGSLPRMRRVGGGEYAGLSALIDAGEQLEHFHLYPVKQATSDDGTTNATAWTMPLHTDAGILAIMTAGLYIHAADGSHVQRTPADAGLYIKTPDGAVVRVAQSAPRSFAGAEDHTTLAEPSSSVIVIAGEGAARWLGTIERPFRAAPHALLVGSVRPSDANRDTRTLVVRAWHGRMLLPPGDALLPTGLSYAEHRAAEAASIAGAARTPARDLDDAPAACSLLGALPPGRAYYAASRRQLVASLGDGSECTTANNTPGLRCWTLCVDSSAIGCTLEDAACYDVSTNLQVNGSDHCPTNPKSNCQLQCKPPTASPPASSSAAEAPSSSPKSSSSNAEANVQPSTFEQPFCSGPGVSMYMQGFGSLLVRPPNGLAPADCVALFAPTWVLNSRGKMAAGAIALALLGLCVEPLARARARIARLRNLGLARHRILIMLCHAAQLWVSYLLMLGAMTYNVELLVAIIAGISLGHGLFFRPSDHGAPAIDACCPASGDDFAQRKLVAIEADTAAPEQATPPRRELPTSNSA